MDVGIAVLLNIRPWSESPASSTEWLHYLRDECGSDVAAMAIEIALLQQPGDNGQYDEWVCATSPRPGVDATLRASGPGQRVGGTVRMTVRRAVAAGSGPQHELLRRNPQGVPFAAACVIPNIEVVQEALAVEPDAEHRPAPQSLHRLFKDAATHKHVMACLESCREACLAEAPAKKARGGPHHVWNVIGELLSAASAAADEQPGQLRVSTMWDPLALRAARPANAKDLVDRGCRCKDQGFRFAEWVCRGCPLGVLRLRPGISGTPQEFIALMRHDKLFELLSAARANPVARSRIFRGYISLEEPMTFRVAAGLQPHEARDDDALASAWHATFKHHLAFIIQTSDLTGGGTGGHATAAELWQRGVLLFIASAPRSRGGKWRMTLASDSPITGDCMLVVLNWVGNCYFASEALRRGGVTPPFRRLTGDASLGGNVLGGILTDVPIRRYLEESGVPLDTEQRGVLEEVNRSENALHIVSALAGAGKTVLAHCIIKCFLEKFYGSDPRRLVLYTVPTRTLRDEVVADIIKFKAAVV